MEDPTQYRKNRISFVEEWKSNDSSYCDFHTSMSIDEFCRSFSSLGAAERGTAVVSVAGRVKSLRASGRKLRFYGLETAQGELQVVASFGDFRGGDLEAFVALHSSVKRGDIIGVTGNPGRTKHGELSNFVTDLLLLSPCLHMLPKSGKTKDEEEFWTPGKSRQLNSYVLRDQESRYRRRYLDIISNPQVKSVFLARASAVRYLRQFLHSRGFLEVETAVLNEKAGGAAAKPFVTRYHGSNKEVVLRIAPELQLKPLLVAGYGGVFEIGKQFRNEGIDLTHNPEFTTCEFYKAYADYNDLMRMTEELLSGMVKEITGGYKILYHSDGLESPPVTIDFTPPFRRIHMLEELEKVMKVKFPDDLASTEANSFLKATCEERGIECSPPRTTARLLDKLVGHYLEDTCVNPTFIIDHPLIMSPLAKRHRSKPGLTERFELFVNKHELVNAYTELNDPVDQRERFYEQLKDRQFGDEEAMVADEDFVVALEHGLPPCAGWGMGIDRLAMLLTDSLNIKEVLVSPAMKPDVSKPDGKPDAIKKPVEGPAPVTTTDESHGIAHDNFVLRGDSKKFYEDRLSFVNKWRATKDAYPHKFEVSMDLGELRSHAESLVAGQKQREQAISVSGRVMSQDGARTLLLESAEGSVEATIDDESSSLDFSSVQLGDVVGLTGFPGKTDQGKVCFFATNLRLLAPCLHLLPKNEALDQETRYQRRYLDIILNSRARSVVYTRDSAFRYIRNFLDERGLMEVETAVLNKSFVREAARPFVTHHNELDIDMFLRVSSALQLKLMIIGGYAGVYEIGKQFRNETADSTHNQELTTCELYMAYANYNDMMQVTENIISGLVTSIKGGPKVCLPNGRAIDFTPPFRRIDVIEELQTALGIELPEDLGSEEAKTFLRNICEERGVDCSSSTTTPMLLETLAERFLGGTCEDPTFILDYPCMGSAKKHSAKAGRGESFKLFVNKVQLVNGHSDLNDPLEQRERLRAVHEEVDEDLITALEHGLPPCAALSLEMDRLVMLLSGFDTVKEALLF